MYNQNNTVYHYVHNKKIKLNTKRKRLTSRESAVYRYCPCMFNIILVYNNSLHNYHFITRTTSTKIYLTTLGHYKVKLSEGGISIYD